jgi:hypothetical protein
MTLRTWGKLLLTTFGVAALTGAGQLGVAYGLGLVRFARAFEPGTENQWHGHLAWIAWYAMVAALVGAVAGSRALGRHRHPAGLGSRMLLAVTAGLGALAVAPLTMQQARAAQLPIAGNPALVAGLSAGLGAMAGILAATAVLSEGAVAWNVGTFAVLVWVTGLASVSTALGPTDPLAVVRLGVPDLSSQAAETGHRVAVLAMPVAALLVGAAVAGLGRWLDRPFVAVALSGLGGPALLALAYLIAGPGAANGQNDQSAPYWGSLVAVAAGLLGSVLVAVVGRRDPEPAVERATIEPTDIFPRPTPSQGDPAHAPTNAPTQQFGTAPTVPPVAPPTSAQVTQHPAEGPSQSAAEPRAATIEPPPGPRQSAAPGREIVSIPAPAARSGGAPEPPPLSEPEPGPASGPKPARPASRSGRRAARVTAAEDEYVGWVKGLGDEPETGPAADDDPAGGRRWLRRRAVGSGRHKAE